MYRVQPNELLIPKELIMQSVFLSTLGLIAVMSSPIAAANTLDKEEWSADLRQEFTTMKHEAVADIQQMNMDAIDERDERIVKHIKEQQAQLVKIKCQKTEATKS
jgi:predicted phage gp36 major capsid-like protein